MTDEVPQEKEYRLHSIRNLYAFDLFCQHRFEDSLNIFTQLGTGLFILLACFQFFHFFIIGIASVQSAAWASPTVLDGRLSTRCHCRSPSTTVI